MTIDKTFDFGPCYNALTEKSIPVLGMWQQPSDNIISSLSINNTTAPLPAHRPESGAVILKGVSLGTDHDILFHCGVRDDVPALFFQEDFDILITLVFVTGQRDFPTCSLLPSNNANYYKIEWGPAWLSETILGKSLYTCEQYLDLLAFHTSVIPISSKENFFDPEWFDPVTNLIADLQYIAQKSKISPKNHIAKIEPLSFVGKVSGIINNSSPEHNSWRIDISDMPLSFSISDKLTHDNIEPIASFLDYNREAFPQLMPVFERYRQLYSLFSALKALKDSGYEMPRVMWENYQSIYQYFLNLADKTLYDSNVCRLISSPH